MDYRFYAVRVFTGDWDRAVAFYRDTLGWPLEVIDAQSGWAQFCLGGADIGLERVSRDSADDQVLVGRFTGISIAVPDIQRSYATLTARGVRFEGPPEQQPWGGWLAHFSDPDGNVLTLLGAPT